MPLQSCYFDVETKLILLLRHRLEPKVSLHQEDWCFLVAIRMKSEISQVKGYHHCYYFNGTAVVEE